jgi:hypothetical protein
MDAANARDTAAASAIQLDDYRLGWCAGYIEALEDDIHILQVLESTVSAPSKPIDWNKGPMGICIPLNVSNGELQRVVVKYLRDNPEQLHEYLVQFDLKILKHAYPCPAATDEKKQEKKP